MIQLNDYQEEEKHLNTDFVIIKNYLLSSDTSMDYHATTNTCLIMLEFGVLNVTAGTRKFKFENNQSIVLAPFGKVEMYVLRSTKVIIYEFKNQLINTVTEKLSIRHHHLQQKQKQDVILLNNQASNIHDTLDELLKMGKTFNRADGFLIDLEVQKLIFYLLDYRTAGQVILSQVNNPMAQVVKHISSSPCENFSIHEFAQSLHMSDSKFSHAFKRHTGMSPTAYINEVKMTYALQLLETKSVTDTSLELGYETPSYFIRKFKEMYALTPKQYQLNIL